MRYVHTNIIAADSGKLIDFYTKVFSCRHIGQTRDLTGGWVDRITGLQNARITGEHLALPGFPDDGPTLEIFTYDQRLPHAGTVINRCGLAHLAFAVDDVAVTLETLKAAGGGTVGEQISTVYPDGRKLTLVYATDPEGNIVEILNWS
jgi:catechol 2,3-dioxygenase-like lactoylglutathione lyase family enzyme